MITQSLNNILLKETNKKQWMNDEEEEIKEIYLATDGSENTTRQILWEAAEAFLRGNFTDTAPPHPHKKNK